MTTTTANDMLTTLSMQMADAVAHISPALVLVNGRRRMPASGVIYQPELVITADHVLEREEDLSVQTHDGSTLAAQFVGRDPASDLAVLRVPTLNAEPAPAASAPARVGQFVLAVGRPSEHGPMASQGIVSAVGGPLRTRRRRRRSLERYVQTDATPYPGFSGGPLIDTQGAVLAILTTGLVGGAALGVPTDLAWQVANSISQQGHVKRGFLGIGSQPVAIPPTQRAGLSQEHGLLLVRIEEGSPAEQGGLLLGDILVGLNDTPITDTDDLQALLIGDLVGKQVALTVIRGGRLDTVHVTVGQRT